MTDTLPPRVEHWYCDSCGRDCPSQLAAARCAQIDEAESD